MKKRSRLFVLAPLFGLLLAAFFLVQHPFFTHAMATAPDRIKVQQNGLYDSVTGKSFIPRGANYIRLAQIPDGTVYHSTFEPGRYDLPAVQAFLNQMQHDGYNTVRVFINSGTFTPPFHGISENVNSHNPIYGPYMDNVASFVEEAASRGIYVLPSVDGIPANIYYYSIAGQPGPNIAGNNILYLDKGFITAKAEYLKQFAAALLTRIGAQNSSDILAYESDNEVFFDASKAPYDKMSETVTPVNGLTYDMSKMADRQQSADASLVEYSYRIKKGLQAADPDALLTMGFFTNYAVGKTGFNGLATYCSTSCQSTTDYRVPGRAAALSIFGAVDFLDIHTYLNNSSYNPVTDLNSIEYTLFKKPYIIGEMGVFKSVYNNNITQAAYGMRNTQIATCTLSAQGWLFWAWDTHENLAGQPLLYMLSDNNGAISGQLAPIVHPDPCVRQRNA